MSFYFCLELQLTIIIYSMVLQFYLCLLNPLACSKSQAVLDRTPDLQHTTKSSSQSGFSNPYLDLKLSLSMSHANLISVTEYVIERDIELSRVNTYIGQDKYRDRNGYNFHTTMNELRPIPYLSEISYPQWPLSHLGYNGSRVSGHMSGFRYDCGHQL